VYARDAGVWPACTASHCTAPLPPSWLACFAGRLLPQCSLLTPPSVSSPSPTLPLFLPPLSPPPPFPLPLPLSFPASALLMACLVSWMPDSQRFAGASSADGGLAVPGERSGSKERRQGPEAGGGRGGEGQKGEGEGRVTTESAVPRGLGRCASPPGTSALHIRAPARACVFAQRSVITACWAPRRRQLTGQAERRSMLLSRRPDRGRLPASSYQAIRAPRVLTVNFLPTWEYDSRECLQEQRKATKGKRPWVTVTAQLSCEGQGMTLQTPIQAWHADRESNRTYRNALATRWQCACVRVYYGKHPTRYPRPLTTSYHRSLGTLPSAQRPPLTPSPFP